MAYKQRKRKVKKNVPEGVAHIAQLTHGLEIIPAPVVGTIESVGNDGHGMLCLSIVRTA